MDKCASWVSKMYRRPGIQVVGKYGMLNLNLGIGGWRDDGENERML